MNRYGIGLIAAATAACTVVGLAACGDSIKDTGAPAGGTGGAANGGSGNSGGSGNNGGSGNSGGSGNTSSLNIPSTCVGECCPSSATCYSSSATTTAPGAECQALRDNTPEDHIQMRQAWIRATTPHGNTEGIVYNVLAGRTDLPMPDCYQGGSPLGSGGYIQIIDFFLGGSHATPPDITKDYSTVGYATQVTAANLQQNLTNGFCNGVDANYSTQIKTGYALTTASITPPDLGFPPGLPLPMGAADHNWVVGPTKAKRLAADFPDPSDPANATWRKDTLAKFADGGEYAKDGFQGIFFYDPATGYAHGYGSMGWTVVYAQDGKSHLAIPIREVETKSRFNDPAHPNCVGTFRTDVLTSTSSPACGSSDPANPAWGGGNCGDHVCNPANNEAPATTKGYFLITELEQIYSPDLSKTLCVSYPGNDTSMPPKLIVDNEGFYDATTASCRSAKWDPKAAGGAGIPKGDWCAATNSAATDTCHDAWLSKSLHVFSGAKIQVGDATNPVKTCPFQP